MEDNRSYPASQLDWVLDDLVARVPYVTRAVFLSQDGLPLGSSRGLEQADAEHLSALAAGFQSLARGTGQHFGGGDVRQTIVEMSSAFFFVSAAGQGTCLAVLTGPEADIGQVAYEMAILVQRTSDRMQVSMRPQSALHGPLGRFGVGKTTLVGAVSPWCFTCSARRGRNDSGSCGTSWHLALSAL